MASGWSAVGFSREIGMLLVIALLAGCTSVGVEGSRSGAASPPESFRRGLLRQAMAGLLFLPDRVAADPAALPAPVLGEAERAALEARAGELLGRNRTIEAIGLLARLVASAPDRPQPFELLGQALVREARTPEAMAAFLTASRLDPGRVSARFAAACCLARLGRGMEAVAELEAIVTEHPEHGGCHTRLAASLTLAGDFEGARRHLDEATRLGSEVPAQLPFLLVAGHPPRAEVRSGVGAVAAGPEIGPQVRVNVGGGSARANETTGTAIVDGAGEVVAGWNDYREPGLIRVGAASSSDGGVTWTDALLRAPAGHQADVEGDPMTAADPRTGTLWVGGMSWGTTGGVFVARKTAGTPGFEPPVMTYVDSAIDKGWLAAGPLPSNPDSTQLYVAYNYGLQRSSDLGATWSGLVGLGWDLGYLPRVGPQGELYVASWDVWDGMWVRRSFDGGATVLPAVRVATLMDLWDVYDAPQIPGSFRAPNLCYLAVSPVDGTLYAVWADTSGTVAGDANVDLYLTRSTDQGSTWAVPWVVNGDGDPPGDQFFPWLEVDGDGRLHLLFYDTRHTVQNDTAPSAMIDAYYAWSGDGGDSWTEHRLTPFAFDSAVTDTGSGQFIGDYLGAGVAGGAVFPVYLSTQNGLREIFTHRIRWPEGVLFADDFESGSTAAWGGVVP